MTLKQLYRQFLEKLRTRYSEGEADVMTGRVFEHFAALTRADVLKDPDKTLTHPVVTKLENAFAQLLDHRPLQYVLGEAWFYKLKFKVNENVLIPRPETEELVDMAIKENSRNDPMILDIGTGSGCIAVSIKKNIPHSTVFAVDTSEAALNVAMENAKANDTGVHFIQLDILDAEKREQLPDLDIIISNPPYIPEEEKSKLDKNVVEYEPHLALFVPDKDPLLFYKAIAALGRTHLNSNGKIYLEVHEDHAWEARSLFIGSYKTAEVIKDMFGRDRMLVVTA